MIQCSVTGLVMIGTLNNLTGLTDYWFLGSGIRCVIRDNELYREREGGADSSELKGA